MGIRDRPTSPRSPWQNAYAERLIGSIRRECVDRRDLVWINVTTNPTAEWVARQITEAFPWDEAPHYLIRDRDRIYGSVVARRLRTMGIRDKPTAPASPWQNAFAERLIGSIRRECLDHIIVLGEIHLRRVLKSLQLRQNASVVA
jgi:transposase InsO family protein